MEWHHPASDAGAGVTFRGSDRATRVIDPRYFRPTEVDVLQGDATKAREKLGWKPTVTFDELAGIMVREDLHLACQELAASRVAKSERRG